MLNRRVVETDENGQITKEYSYKVDDNVIVFNKDRNFIKLFTSQLKKLKKKVSQTETLILLDLTHYISYESGMLTKTGENDSRYPLTNKDIEKITEFSPGVVIKSMIHLVDVGVFARTKVGKNYIYFANPFIFCKGVKINKTLIDMFKKFRN